jgi:CelD/BcsL family acetyltransferase involved in cellulose biosynthesis
VRTIAVYNIDELAPHIPAWDRLTWETPQRIPTLSSVWVDAFLRHRLAANEKWFCIFAYTGDELIGVLTVIVSPHPILGKHRPLLRTPADAFMTTSGDIALAPNQAAKALSALLAQASREVPGHLGLELKAVRQNSPVLTALQSGIRGYIARKDRVSQYSLIDVQGDFANYLAKLGNLRRNLTRYRKKLDNRGSVSVELRKGSAAGEDFLPEFLKLEASGWKGHNGTAILNDQNRTAFFTTLVKNLAKQGRLEWHIIRVQDRIVAAGIGVQCRGALVLPKIAYDEDFSDCMPGNLLTEEVIKDALQRPEVVEINHMSNASWHASWRMSHDRYTTVHLVRRCASAMLFQLPPIAARSVYREHVRPRIPNALKEARRKFHSQKQHLSQPKQVEPKSLSVFERARSVAVYVLSWFPGWL